MLDVKYLEDGSNCNTPMYAENPEKYLGSIACHGCDKKAWYVRSYETIRAKRSACFAAHHIEGCNYKTETLEVEQGDDSEEGGADAPDFYVDLDKSKGSGIYVSTPANKHADKVDKRDRKKIVAGGDSGFSVNKTLRQILTMLCKRNAEVPLEKEIMIVADSGRPVIDGSFKDVLFHFSEMGNIELPENAIFWGEINHTIIREENTFLNSGGKKDATIIVPPYLHDDLIRNFKLQSLDELHGADVIIVGHGYKPEGLDKFFIHATFTKYMSFRKYKVTQESEEQAIQA
ncbi:hypothetical protein [Chitinolyticbacter meiyuanensis]|uniref:hypothetical protein n=1 Tax=Chitinolyticbacter meiyuanensis TaxID=682798 RepID=UPI0011E5B5C7|nr:hypothetical protein [Chitinolyticbacter meiyuanensis]